MNQTQQKTTTSNQWEIYQWEWHQPYTMIQDEITARFATVKDLPQEKGISGGRCD
jgi:hypothetical protein